VANFTGTPTSGTAPLAVTFTDTSTGSPTAWSWNFGDSNTSTVQNPSHTYAAGTYTVTLTATNAGGSDGETKTNYITATQSAPVANFTGSPTSGTTPLTVNFTDTSTNSPTSWSWSFGDSGTSTVQNPSHQYTSFGKYTVTLTATNAAGSDGETKTNYVAVSNYYPATSWSQAPMCGTLVSGTVTNVQTSDNTYLQLRAPSPGYQTGGRFTIATGLTPSQVSKITVQVERHTSRTDATGKLVLTMRRAPDWVGYDDVWSAAAFGTSDAWMPDWATTSVSTYMDSSGVVTLDFGGGCSLTTSSTWDLYLDTIRLKLDP
jgi:PKD repeat protein